MRIFIIKVAVNLLPSYRQKMNSTKDAYQIADLLKLMERLRDRDNGCPWDIEQNFESIKPHTVEEAYEVADAIERGDMNDLKDELGDLLFQIVFHAQMANEMNLFSFDDIVDHVTKKMIFRHPHVFENDAPVTAEDVSNHIWDRQKDKEKAGKTALLATNGALSHAPEYVLNSLTMNLPSLLLANKIQKKVRKAGFAYSEMDEVFAKLDEEIAELREAIDKEDAHNIEEEYGDILFVAALIGQHIKIDAEQALRKANIKFIERFGRLEDDLSERGLSVQKADITQMLMAWRRIKNT